MIPDKDCRQRRCYGPSESGPVYCCSFHPTKPKLACGLDGGRVCLFSVTDHSISFAEWTETVLQAAESSWVKCIDWKVRHQSSSCANIFQNKKYFCLQVDGSKLAAGLNDGTVAVWCEDGTKSFELKQNSKIISSISWNGVEQKSHLLVTGSADQVNNLQIE